MCKIFVMISEQKITRCTYGTSLNKVHTALCTTTSNSFTSEILSCELLVFIDINTYIITDVINFETIMKQNYAVALDSCYMFTKKNVEHGIKHDIYSAYGVYINNTFLNFKAVSMNTLQFK